MVRPVEARAKVAHGGRRRPAARHASDVVEGAPACHARCAGAGSRSGPGIDAMRDRRPGRKGEAAAARREPLPPPSAQGPSLFRVLAARRSCREFAHRSLTDLEVGSLLWAGQGITSPQGFRAAPSAGALHPLTLTLVDSHGVWRYQPDGHALVLIRVGDRRRQLAAAALGQEAVAEAPASIVVTANPAVLRPRYRGRAERYCILEAGHVAQNVLLEATALGLAGVPIGAFDDPAVLAAVDLGPEHLALYVVSVGAARSDGT